jgi:phospholipid-binding lipoprotein MlaA
MSVAMSRSLRGSAIGFVVLALIGCASAPIVVPEGQPAEPVFPYDRIVPPDAEPALQIYDPWEPMNRTIYRFNYHLDKWVLLPVVKGYRTVTPRFLRTGVHNFFNNFFEIRTFGNQLLQFRPVPAVHTLGRFLVNSTVGLLGLIDVASPIGIPYYDEDFGQTLGRWGLGPGPYLVLPLLGPSSLRDGFGDGVDAFWMGELDPLDLDDSEARRIAYYTMLVIDTRNSVEFRYFGTGSPYEYELVRLMITTKRELDVEK